MKVLGTLWERGETPREGSRLTGSGADDAIVSNNPNGHLFSLSLRETLSMDWNSLSTLPKDSSRHMQDESPQTKHWQLDSLYANPPLLHNLVGKGSTETYDSAFGGGVIEELVRR